MTLVATVEGPRGSRLVLRARGGYYDVADVSASLGIGDLRGIGDVGDLFRRGHAAVDHLREVAGRLDGMKPVATEEAELRFLPPVTSPTKIVCVGLNYRLHAAEGGVPLPSRPVLFAKFPSALTGHRSAIAHHTITSQLDYEGELAVIVGRRCSRVSADDALAFVGAYTIINDVSARDLQSAEPQWIRAKSLDTFAPIGPNALLPDAGFDPATLRIRTTVSGEVRQDASCSDMVHSVPEILAFISQAITLEPGDIIATGTPQGVGLGFDPPRYLSPGDSVSVEIGGIGVLTNHVVAP
jgi:2-keto-4-pentenoate hydratase/2-oxohepta-3-ene-1,7-dioic acid hydratase in catechol pathway